MRHVVDGCIEQGVTRLKLRLTVLKLLQVRLLLGHVLVRDDPVPLPLRSIVDRDCSTAGQLALDIKSTVGDQLADVVVIHLLGRSARIIPHLMAMTQKIFQVYTRNYGVCREAEEFDEVLVSDQQPEILVPDANTLAHVLERDCQDRSLAVLGPDHLSAFLWARDASASASLQAERTSPQLGDFSALQDSTKGLIARERNRAWLSGHPRAELTGSGPRRPTVSVPEDVEGRSSRVPRSGESREASQPPIERCAGSTCSWRWRRRPRSAPHHRPRGRRVSRSACQS